MVCQGGSRFSWGAGGVDQQVSEPCCHGVSVLLCVVLGVIRGHLVFSVEEHLVRHTVLLFVAYSVGKHLV